jgi:uncharacterized protein involved in exopolysaccharide biosynthesis/Mrp family chromosome partitioning ATPase
MSNASPDNIDMGAVLSVIGRKVPRLAILSAIMGALTFAGLSLVAPRYQSEAELVVSSKGISDPFSSPRKDGGGGSDSVSVRMDKEAVNTHVRALLSPELGLQITKDLNLADWAEFNPEIGSPDTLSAILRLAGIGAPRPGENINDRILNRFYERLEVYSPRESRAIAIRFTSNDADLSANVANSLAEAYRQSLAEQSIVETDEVQQALAPKIDRLKEEVAAGDAAVKKFRGEANIFKGGQQSTGLNEQQLAELTAELSRAQSTKSDIDARLRAARDMMKSGSGDAIPEVQKSPLIQNVVQQRVRLERQISELSATLLPGHPRMQQLNADLAGLKKQIAGEVAKVVDSLDKEAKAASLRVAAVTKDIDSVKLRVIDTGPDEVKLRQLEAEAQSKRVELERLQAQYEANRAKADSRAVPIEAKIVSRARAASIPVFPRKGAFAALAAFATFLFGLALTITKALLSGARSAVAVETRTPATARGGRATSDRQEPVLVPATHAPPESQTMASHQAAMPAPVMAAAATPVPPAPSGPPSERAVGGPIEPSSCEIAHVGTIGALTRRISSRATSGGYRTLVTGETALQGVSSHATELAKALTELGHSVVLIDWSPEGDGIAEAAGLKSSAGIAELLAGSATFEMVIKRLPASEAHLIGAGAFDRDLADHPEADRLNLVLDALDEAYDHVVVAGRHEAARNFFEAIEGRVDCGVTIADSARIHSVLRDPPGTYLGFEVADIDLVRYDRQQAAAPAQRLVRAGGGLDKSTQAG